MESEEIVEGKNEVAERTPERIKSNWLKMSGKMKIVNWNKTYRVDWFNRSKEFAVNFDGDSCVVYSICVSVSVSECEELKARKWRMFDTLKAKSSRRISIFTHHKINEQHKMMQGDTWCDGCVRLVFVCVLIHSIFYAFLITVSIHARYGVTHSLPILIVHLSIEMDWENRHGNGNTTNRTMILCGWWHSRTQFVFVCKSVITNSDKRMVNHFNAVLQWPTIFVVCWSASICQKMVI